MIEKIKQIIREDYNRLVSIRRDIHSHPELGFEEYRTQALIINELEKLNCYEITKSAKTGVVALIKGNIETENPKCVGIRADIDALPIDDVKEVEYKSLNKGLCNFQGEVLFTSRDYELNSTVANRVIEIKPEGTIVDRSIPYEEYIEKK